MMRNNPIGVFDSGVGGTSIWKEIQKLLPHEDIIYLADSSNAPYGEKSEKEIIELSIKNTELLLQKKCKMIVVACNTATTNAITYLRENYDVPFIGIEPAIKPAALQSQSKKVGILATKGTLSSSLFHSTAENHASGIQVIEQEGTGLVAMIEAGLENSSQCRRILNEKLTPMLDAGIDYLVLGCTHYPYLIPALKEILPANVAIIDSGEAVARQTKSILEQNNLLNMKLTNGKHQFYTNTDVTVLNYFIGDVSIDVEIGYLTF